MTTYIVRRIIQAMIVLLIVTLMLFMAMRLLPGDPIYMIMTSGELNEVSTVQIEAVRHQFGLDRPLIVQYLDWLKKAGQGDLGVSIVQRTSVLNDIGRVVPITLNLSILAFIISLIIGIPAGVICAIRRGSWMDTVVTVLSNVGITVPVFWLGIMLIYLFALQLHWLPVQGYTSPFDDLVKNLRQIVLPVFCLAIFSICSIARQTRSSMLEVMGQDYIRTAWSKGLKERSVIIRHGLRNSLIPVVTLSGMSLSYIIGGSVLIETVFNIPGMGRLAVNAVFGHDYPMVQGTIFIIAITILLVNLLVDISYGWLDPRIRYG
jgi:peptide/nickel transport system permease protein